MSEELNEVELPGLPRSSKGVFQWLTWGVGALALAGAAARLDDDFEGGKIKEEVYRGLRAKKKSQLVTLIENQRE
ncbi:MAG: hypothetical protein Q8O05_05435 [Chloroflexota bacterium]|nr:hypothetical protein [Chloroflexota bacterium]